MSITLNGNTFTSLGNNRHLLDGTAPFAPETSITLNPPTKNRRASYVSGGITTSQERELTGSNGDTSVVADQLLVQFRLEKDVTVADIQDRFAELNAFVQSSNFSAYLRGQSEF
jgi:methylmalonyl-CoA mutase N-terminal domain/subunit